MGWQNIKVHCLYEPGKVHEVPVFFADKDFVVNICDFGCGSKQCKRCTECLAKLINTDLNQVLESFSNPLQF